MKKILMLLVVLSLFCCFSVERAYCQQGESISQKIENTYNSFLQNEFVANTLSSIKSGWASFKKWFSQLPGIKQYNESVYSGDNWKKTMNSMGHEYKPHLQSNSAGANMLKEGREKWKNL